MDNNGRLKGKRMMVTGATSGIGEVTALELARQGAEVIVVSRNEDRCLNTVEKIKRETQIPEVSYLVADLSSQEEIRSLVDGFQSQYDTLDVLVNNAGAFFWERRESVDGIEMTFALNHLNYFLLTNLLLDTLKASAPARIINVSSDAHRGQEMDFEDLQGEEGYQHFKAYRQSKLANVLFTYELDRRLAGTGVTVNAVHPGFVSTNFARQGSSLVRFLMPVLHLFALSPEKGAETSIYLASSPEVAGVSGKYFTKKEPVSSSPASYDQEAAKRLWDISAEMTGLA
jgi:NAD(P)-dependent dehydrogenase (short-subunit alcohol dehydrogenase family)